MRVKEGGDAQVEGGVQAQQVVQQMAAAHQVGSQLAPVCFKRDGSVLQSTPPGIEAALDNDGDIPPFKASGSVMGVYARL